MSKRIFKKTKVVNTDPSANNFTSLSTMIVEPNDAIIIEKALKEAKLTEDEKKLVALELEKPASLRNQALMRKYGYLDSSSSVDAYPDTSGAVKYKIVARAPEEDGIPKEKRPSPYYTSIDFGYLGNHFTFQFPLHRATSHDGATVYKLDGFDVFLDSGHNVIEDISEYDLFQALTDFKNEETYQEASLAAILTKYGIGIADNKDFRIKNHGFSVTSQKISSKNVKDKKPVKDSDNKQAKPLLITKVDDSREFNYYGVDRVSELVLRAFEQKVKNGGVPVKGLNANQSFDDVVFYVALIYTNKKMSADTWTYLDYDEDANEVRIILVNGAGAAKGQIKYNGTAKGLTEYVENRNQTAYKMYKLYQLDQ